MSQKKYILDESIADLRQRLESARKPMAPQIGTIIGSEELGYLVCTITYCRGIATIKAISKDAQKTEVDVKYSNGSKWVEMVLGVIFILLNVGYNIFVAHREWWNLASLPVGAIIITMIVPSVLTALTKPVLKSFVLDTLRASPVNSL